MCSLNAIHVDMIIKFVLLSFVNFNDDYGMQCLKDMHIYILQRENERLRAEERAKATLSIIIRYEKKSYYFECIVIRRTRIGTNAIYLILL